MRPILVRFTTPEGKNVVLGNRSLLRGQRIWADNDLTPLQMETKKRELLKVKEARDAGWIAFLRDDQAVIAGNLESWRRYDILAFVETWDSREDLEVKIEGFSCLIALWNAKKYKKGRGFGGISIWFREGLSLKLQVEYTDKLKQFVCVGVSEGNSKSFLFSSYFAPAGAPLYSRLAGDSNPYSALSRIVLRFREIGKIWLFGDFNARTGNLQDERLEELDGTGRVQSTVNPWPRDSLDSGRNLFTDHFLQFTAVCGLTIINGTPKFPNSGGFTYSSEHGASVVDYCLSSEMARDSVRDCLVGSLLPESDHAPLSCILSDIYFVVKAGRRKGATRKLLLDKSLQDDYALNLSRVLDGRMVSAEDLPDTLIRTARTVFHKEGVGRQPWFDEGCFNARREALEKPLEVRQAAYRSYRHFIRAKKRRFVRDTQKNAKSFGG
ncbi:hypothetical protein R1sor_007358 [Riccia sorocarpa]|uniref:Endonuclease/exonuclease/phosphatase domain-containing protein n=1 Tax=Riccia sorocarpa TaxID=122646 RepID=A0ABD3HQ86_9MARC